MPLIFYIHGRFGSVSGDKVTALQAHYGASMVIPLSYDPESPLTAQVTLMSQIEAYLANNKNHRVLVVGSSLGAFWAARVAYLLGCPSVLMNPCFDPITMINGQLHNSVKPLSSPISSDYDSRFFDFIREQDVDILLAVHDELFASFWSRLRLMCPNCRFTNDQTSSHRFENIKLLIEVIDSVLKRLAL